MVTCNRYKRFNVERDFGIAREALAHVRKNHVFKILAWAILPDHIHLLIQPDVADYSIVVSSLKRRISWKYRDMGLHSRYEKSWQDRFWEHTIKDEEDHQRCVEYINYNPVRHGLVKSPCEWEHSSFKRYVELGIYDEDWGAGCDVEIEGAEYD